MEQLPQRSRRKNKKLAQAAKLLALGKLRFPSTEEKEPETQVNEALAALGLVMSSEAAPSRDETFALWPENEESFEFWRKLRTQWVIDVFGNRSLNYSAVESVMNMTSVPKKKRPQLFEEIRVMEMTEINARAERRSAR